MRMGNFDFKNLKQFSGKECPLTTLIINKSCQTKNDSFMNDSVLPTVFFPTSQRKILLSGEDLKKKSSFITDLWRQPWKLGEQLDTSHGDVGNC